MLYFGHFWKVHDRVNFQDDAEKMYNSLKENSVEMQCQTKIKGCCFCAGPTNSFAILPRVKDKSAYGGIDLVGAEKVRDFYYITITA